jgi:two-component system KDP operon response regulator KdpE
MIATATLKVLLINGELTIRKLLRKGLSAKHYQILEAANAKTALELLNQCPDLVVLDLGLGDIQGHELIRMIRSPTKYIVIVALSGRDDEADKDQAFDLGPNDFVTEPFRIGELLARVRAALQHESEVIHGDRVTNAALSAKLFRPSATDG